MESVYQFFIEYGYLGMGLAAFLAGTFVPFNSELVLGALVADATLDPFKVIIYGTVGNVAGTVFNYYIGRFWDVETISRRMRIKEKRLLKTKEYVEKKGSWIALFTFLPIFGSAIAIALGILRANVLGVTFFSFVGKFARYVIVAMMAMAIF